MKKCILVLEHVDIEGPGSMRGFFENSGRPLREVFLAQNGALPERMDGLSAIISLGGPMNVYEEDKYPFLKPEEEFLRKAVKEEIPVVGVCLGAQMLAKACGAKVRKNPRKEIGWHKVSLNENGRNDPLFRGLAERLDVFQWHEDTFDIPEGAVPLASSDICRNQAFRFGKNAYGLQFHIEITPEIVRSWIIAYAKEDPEKSFYKNMIGDCVKKRDAYEAQARSIYKNLSLVMDGRING